MDEYNMSRNDVQTFFSKTFPTMRRLCIVEQKTTGTPTHCAWEMLLEVEYDIDEPRMAIKAGAKAFVRGVAVQEWRWEGDEEGWQGGLEDDQVRGWKIVRGHDYMVSLKSEDGRSLRLFDGGL